MSDFKAGQPVRHRGRKYFIDRVEGEWLVLDNGGIEKTLMKPSECEPWVSAPAPEVPALPDGWEWRTELDGKGWYASDGETWVSCQHGYVNFTKDSDVMGIPIAVVEAVIARNKQVAK